MKKSGIDFKIYMAQTLIWYSILIYVILNILTNKCVNTLHFYCPRIVVKKIAPLSHKKTRANATISRCFPVQTTCLQTVIRMQLCIRRTQSRIVCMGPPYSLYVPPYKNCKISIFHHISLTSIYNLIW